MQPPYALVRLPVGRAEEIAAGLSEAQRALLSAFNADDEGEVLPMRNADEQRVLSELCELGLAAFIRAVFVFGQLTVDGLAVRRVLEGEL